MLKVIDKIVKEHVFEEVEASDKDTLFKDLSERISKVSSQTSDVIYDALKKREDEYTTNIGNGVAVPHGRIDGYGKTDIFLGFLKEEVNYDSDSDENSPVKLVFAIISDVNTPEDYLSNLSEIFFLVNQKDILDKIIESSSFDALHSYLEGVKNLDEKYETEKQIKFLIELDRAEFKLKEIESNSENASDAVISEYKKYIDTITSKIDVSTLDKYKRIKDSKGGRALSKITNYKCSSCNVAIPKMTVAEVRRQKQIMPCFHCGKILYATE